MAFAIVAGNDRMYAQILRFTVVSRLAWTEVCLDGFEDTELTLLGRERATKLRLCERRSC